MTTDLAAKMQQAYIEWRKLAPYRLVMPAQSVTYEHPTTLKTRTFVEPPRFDGQCCRYEHVDSDGIPLPDEKVCERERAWRNYVRARDLAESVAS